ncbi:MAG: hypothetical protein ABI920_03450 [Casimicrobiaceae bacterium]
MMRCTVPFSVSGLLLAAFLANMALRIARIKFGVDVASFGDVGEFVLVLLCMVFFVAGLLVLEARTPSSINHKSKAPEEEPR